MISFVPIQRPADVWPLVKEMIEPSLDEEDFETIEHIYDDLLNAHRQLWVVLSGGDILAAVLTTIQEYHGKRYGMITHAGGRNASDWFHIVNPIGEYFKKEGCVSFQIIGRKGWARYLKDFKANKIILEKTLDG